MAAGTVFAPQDRCNAPVTAAGLRIAGNLAAVRRRMEDACARSGRTLDSVTLVAAVKYAKVDWVRELVSLGQLDLGESRPQQLVERAGLFTDPVRWHLIGHLQRNKARKVLSLATCVHSVDTWKLLHRLETLAGEMDLAPRVLLEINVACEAAKHGFDPADVESNWQQALRCRRVQIAGLMTMAPWSDDPEDARPVFRSLRELRDRLVERSAGALALEELSMGMSHDFEVAIGEGATIIRVGSDLFAGL
ncbi:MAG: YggS family pyridoxal phosphate-dependent enzyme [Planctomycetes bacterium]|nr:YggS family pyridoxal phosphate-dependent enzyme [Planctomycetota bacterium]